MKINILLSMPRSGSSLLSQLIESDETTAVRLSPFFSYKYRDISHSIRSEADVAAWANELIHSKDDFVTQATAKKKGYFPSERNISVEKRILYVKDTRNFHDYIRLFFLCDEVNIVFLTRQLSQQLKSWVQSPEWKDLEYNSENLIYASQRKGLEDNASDEYWGVADNFFFKRLSGDFVHKYPKRCVQLNYDELISGELSKLLIVDPDLNLTRVINRLELLSSKETTDRSPYSVFRKRGYSGEELTEGELPADIIQKILVGHRD